MEVRPSKPKYTANEIIQPTQINSVDPLTNDLHLDVSITLQALAQLKLPFIQDSLVNSMTNFKIQIISDTVCPVSPISP